MWEDGNNNALHQQKITAVGEINWQVCSQLLTSVKKCKKNNYKPYFLKKLAYMYFMKPI